MTDDQSELPEVHDFKDLRAWQIAMDFAESVYSHTRAFPPDERWGLSLQLRKAAVSVPSNIAEGHGRIARAEFARFALIARGSLNEVETQLLLSQRLGYSNQAPVEDLLHTADRLGRLIYGLNRSLRRKK